MFLIWWYNCSRYLGLFLIAMLDDKGIVLDDFEAILKHWMINIFSTIIILSFWQKSFTYLKLVSFLMIHAKLTSFRGIVSLMIEMIQRF